MKRLFALIAIGACMSVATSARAATENWKQKFAQLSDEYFDQVYFPYAPTVGTQVGYHQYDTKLENYSRKSIDAEIAALKNFERRIEAIQPGTDAADFVPRSDREIVLGNIRSQLLTLRNHSSVGKECRQLLQHMRQRCFCSDGAQVRAA